MTTYCAVLQPDIQGRAGAERTPDGQLDEAVALTAAIDLEIVHSEIVRISKIDSGRFITTGHRERLHDIFKAKEVDLVIINHAISPVQQRNLERDWKVKVLDRTALILEIFGERAQTKEGVLQVELAHLTYQKSRLVRSWTHLERQRGGAGFLGGPGETQIESDRRAIDDQIDRIKRKLEKVVQTRELHRASREKIPYPIVALVGYTNAGKSTLFNRLTGATVMAEDMLFATLDPTMRRINLPSGREVILSDTVGFISELPTTLIAAFRATLEEVLAADLILHVRDIAHEDSALQAQDVRTVLAELGVSGEDNDIPIHEVWNKVDLLETLPPIDVARDDDSRPSLISAITGEGVGRLTDRIEAYLAPLTTQETLFLPFAAAQARAWLFEENVVESEATTEKGYELDISWSEKSRGRFIQRFGPMDM